MKKILLSGLVLMLLVACGAKSNGTADSRHEAAIKMLTEENVTLKVTLSTAFSGVVDKVKVSYAYDNFGDVTLDETVSAKVKVEIDGNYTDVEITAKGDEYTVKGEGLDFAGLKEDYIAEVGAALYGDFRTAFSFTKGEITEVEKDGVTSATFTVEDSKTLLEILALNELHALEINDSSAEVTFDYDAKDVLQGGVIYIEFVGMLDGVEQTGNLKLEFSTPKA